MTTKYKCLYEITGRIEDVATFLVPISELPKEPEQEPDGHFLDFAYADSTAQVYVYDQFQKGQQFYTSPPQRTAAKGEDTKAWVGLTDEERMECFNSSEWNDLMQYAEVIEAKLKEKNSA